jgi:hypothetical protein
MSQYFTHYWQNSTWRDTQARGEGERLVHIAGNLFNKRGVEVGDIVYIVTVFSGNLFLCGKLKVGKLCDVHQAAKDLECKPQDLWEASEHIVASEATPMRFDRSVPSAITANLRFVQPKGSTALKFVAPGYLDQQTMRGVRQLEPSSAAELDSVLPAMQVIKRRRLAID